MIPVRLPSGATALLRDAQQVTERARRPLDRLRVRYFATDSGRLARSIAESGEEPTQDDALALQAADGYHLMDEMNDAAAAALVAEWSYDFPVTAESIADLPGPDYRALIDAVTPHVNAMTPGFEPDPAPDSPTGPSDVSGPPSEASGEDRNSNTSASTATANSSAA